MTREREGTLPVDGACIWYRTVGTGPLLFVQTPGWGIGSALYQSTLGDLAQRFTLVFHDTRGSGRSVIAGDDFAMVNVGRFVLDLEALRQHLGIDRFMLMGHSHGGYIAMNYALAYPGRVTALVLVASQLGVDEPQEDLRRTLPVLAGDSRFAAAAAAFQAPGKFADDAEFSGFLRQVAPLYFKEPSGHGYERFSAYLDEHQVPLKTFQACAVTNRHFPVRARLAELQIPTLCLVGQADFICSPVQSQAIHGSIAKSVLVEFLDSGHFCWLEEAELFRSAVSRFLNGSLADDGNDSRALQLLRV
jgi:proline iminopeptidase